MRPDKKTSIINSFMFGITTVIFLVMVFSEKFFVDNPFLENLIMVPVMFCGAFLLGNTIVGIPSFIYYYLTNHTFEDFYELPKKKQRTIICIVFIILWITISIIVTYC